MISVKYEIKRMFFDKPAVMRSVDKMTRQVLSKFGAYVRTRAVRSMRKRKGPSSPGEPPHAHEGSLRRFTFFAWDDGARSVVIGPLRFGRSADGVGVPERLEYGAHVRTRKERRFRLGKSQGRDGRGRFTKKRMRYTVLPKGTLLNIEARPFMGPAYSEEKNRLPSLWRDRLKKA